MTHTKQDFSDLKAVAINTSLKKSSQKSHTQLLLNAACNIMEQNHVSIEKIHMLDHNIAYGVQPDMTEHGWNQDDFPKLWKTISDADIMIIGTPLWLGEESSLCRLLIERLYGMSGQLNNKGQSIYYNKTGGAIITGNEDGIKHTAMTILYALQHLGYTIPPQADCGWIGEAGPGPSYGDKKDDGNIIGFDNEFTKRNTTIMTWNLMHMARLLKDNTIPNTGNDRNEWDTGSRFGFENPEYRS